MKKLRALIGTVLIIVCCTITIKNIQADYFGWFKRQYQKASSWVSQAATKAYTLLWQRKKTIPIQPTPPSTQQPTTSIKEKTENLIENLGKKYLQKELEAGNIVAKIRWLKDSKQRRDFIVIGLKDKDYTFGSFQQDIQKKLIYPLTVNH